MTLSLSQFGRIVHYSSSTQMGWLLSSSKSYLGLFLLEFKQDLTGKTKRLVLFSDQLEQQDRRRLSRIIKSLPFV